VSASGDRTLRLWNLETLQEFGPPLTGHDFGVNAISCGRLGDTGVIVSGSEDGTIRIWKPTRATGPAARPARHDTPVTAMAITQILGQPVIVTGSQDGTIRLSSVDGQLLGFPLSGPRGAVRTVTTATTLDGVPVAVAGSADGTIWRWNLLTREPLSDPIVAGGGDVSSGEVWSVRVIQMPFGESMIAATADYRRPEVHRWDLAGGFKYRQLVADDYVCESVPAITVGTVRGEPVLVAARQDDTLILWNLEKRTSITFVGHTGWTKNWNTIGLADSIAFGELRDGTPIIVCPNVDQTIRVVAAESGQEVRAPLAGHTGFVFSVRFGLLKGAPACVSAGADRTVRLWDLTSGQQVAAFTADAPVTCCEIDSDSGTVLAGDHFGAIHILRPVS
jgi:WD40 repeat protein